MKKLILYFFSFFILFSCNNDASVEAKSISIPTGSLKTDTGTIVLTDTVAENLNARKIGEKAKLLLIARGSEPGWYAEFFADHLRLLIDNGTDSLILQKDFSSAINNSFSINVSENNLVISVKDKACTESGSGETREKSISIKYNNKTYKGCATAK